MSNGVFIDSSFWIAFRDDDDARHIEASGVMEQLCRRRTRFVITLPVLCEIHAAFSKARETSKVVLKELSDNPLVTIEDLSVQDRKAAIDLLHSNPDKAYSLCDALSFILMRRLGIRQAAAFDRHFHQIGEFEIIC